MIALFRRYQRYIYIVVTIVIVLSFSFFGTYSASMRGSGQKDVVVATLIDKTPLYKSECVRFMQFLSIDPLSGVEGGHNALNGDFLTKDIILSSFGDALVEAILPQLEIELQEKLIKEKKFVPYQHPKAPFVSAMGVWNYFAPNIKDTLASLQHMNSETSCKDLYLAKKNLFAAQHLFPSLYLRQILSYQQQQLSWLEPDTTLHSRPFNLFGYSTIEDWFGHSFITSSVLAILNTASLAQKEGFYVSYDEAKSALYSNAKLWTQKYVQAEKQQVEEIINKTLVGLHLEEYEAVSFMQKILLFKKAVSQIPSHFVVASHPFRDFLQQQMKEISLQGYAFAPYMCPKSEQDVVKIQTWIDICSSPEERGITGLALPRKFYSAEQVLASTPQLVQKRYHVSIAQVNQEELFEKIRVKDIWTWLEQDAHWDELIQQYPILLEKKSNSAIDRVHTFESLSGQARKEVDTTIRKAIAASRVDWIGNELRSATPTAQTLYVRYKGGADPLTGIANRAEFLDILSQAAIGENDPALMQYTQDGIHFYQIVVLDRSQNPEIVSLKSALDDGVLDQIVDRDLKEYYSRLQADDVQEKELQKENSGYRDFEEVKSLLLKKMWASFFTKLTESAMQMKDKMPFGADWKTTIDDKNSSSCGIAARFLPYLDFIHDKVACGEEISSYIALEDQESKTPSFLPQESDINATWNIRSFMFSMKAKDIFINESMSSSLANIFQEKTGSVTPIFFDTNRASSMFAIVGHTTDSSYKGQLFQTLATCCNFVGEEALQLRAKMLLQKMKEHNALVVSSQW